MKFQSGRNNRLAIEPTPFRASDLIGGQTVLTAILLAERSARPFPIVFRIQFGGKKCAFEIPRSRPAFGKKVVQHLSFGKFYERLAFLRECALRKLTCAQWGKCLSEFENTADAFQEGLRKF